MTDLGLEDQLREHILQNDLMTRQPGELSARGGRRRELKLPVQEVDHRLDQSLVSER